MGSEKMPDNTDTPKQPYLGRRFGKIARTAAAAFLLGTTTPADSAGASGPESATRDTTVARLVEPERDTQREEANGQYFWIINNDPAKFWLNIHLGLYKYGALTDEVMLYAAEKSPRGYWDALSGGDIPADRFLTDTFITTALRGTSGVEYFLRLVAEKESIGTLLSLDDQNRFMEVATVTDPVNAAHFMYRYYQEHEQKDQFWGNDLILEGVQTWRATQLEKEKSGTPDPDWHTKLMWVLNHAYVLPHDTRASIVAGLDPRTIYNIAVADPDGIYTSSFKKVLAPHLEQAIRKAGSVQQFLRSVGTTPEQTSAFLELSGVFGEFSRFLQYANENDITTLGSGMVTTLEQTRSEPDIAPAVALVEFLVASHALPQIPETTKLRVEHMVRVAYDRAENTKPKNTIGVIASVYARATNTADHPELHALQESYPIADFSTLTESQLFTRGADGVLRHIERWFFADSPDGRGTVDYELAHFQQEGGWNIVRHAKEGYITLTKRVHEREVVIYMNTPDSIGVQEGDKNIAHLLQNTHVHTIAIRGHSYEVEPALTRIEEADIRNPSLVHIGSCGGGREIKNILDLSDTPGLPLIISSKGTGDKINNHKIRSNSSNHILRRGAIFFPEVWDGWDVSKDYVPPHKNFGAMVVYGIKFYNAETPATTQ